MAVPVQVTPPLVYDGVMVKVTINGELAVLVSVPLILPEPLADIPVTVAVLSRVQAKLVPAVLLLLTIVVIAAPLQMFCDAGVATALGIGFTFTTALAVPVHPLAETLVATTE